MRLRAPTDSDVPIFFENEREPDAMRIAAFTAKDPNDREAFVARWARIREKDDVRIRTIEVADGVVAGYVASFLREGVREVSYWLGRAHWGRGIASAALAKFLEEETRRPLVGRAASDNVTSRRVLEKCGFVLVTRERAFANARGEEIEEVVMRLD